jgi:hypothetical protein
MAAAKTESKTELHWQGKFRGVDFAPLCFQIKTVTHELLKDSKGGLIPTVICNWLTETAIEAIDQQIGADRRKALAIIAANRTISLSELANKMGWATHAGKPAKSRADRCVRALKKAKWLDADHSVTPAGLKILSDNN